MGSPKLEMDLTKSLLNSTSDEGDVVKSEVDEHRKNELD
jgi:hypothetical protein